MRRTLEQKCPKCGTALQQDDTLRSVGIAWCSKCDMTYMV